jgi:hypothetical protein
MNNNTLPTSHGALTNDEIIEEAKKVFEKRFSTTQEVVTTKIIPFSVDELRTLINLEKPKEIWHAGWSSRKPFLIITEYNIEGFMMYCTCWADKTPMQYDAEKLHSYLKYQGMESCYINSDVI